MPETPYSVDVTGTIKVDSRGIMLVLAERLDGHDTFRRGQLQFADGQLIGVRILTLDDVTVLRVLGHLPTSLPEPWAGVLHLPHGWRIRNIPEDLSFAADVAHRDLTALDDAELRYALTFLKEASTDTIRRARIDAIVSALPPLGSKS